MRLGEFVVLVGINLLREGLDIPEVSLVAILDADKEGFLRSERSLIQTIGRAARNLNGRAILYGDRVTGSMQRAIDESARRRNVQLEFNQRHNITPVGVKKKVLDIMEGAYSTPGSRRQRGRGVAEKSGAYLKFDFSDPVVAKKEIDKLETQMYEQARNLAFEEAAATRDRLADLRNRLLMQ